ncbi:hypothetical protein [Rubinisphaera margarita]|uniref:hypothetical protein n=1 Tax=Rubinisphaera margarita TaxID=2909586 RepID=UPI001EE8562A|nr:hypothetical protein [Rubinisphaera margarita]MCG6156406.1 hypothetical protein [Rubinisphaera margarita]
MTFQSIPHLIVAQICLVLLAFPASAQVFAAQQMQMDEAQLISNVFQNQRSKEKAREHCEQLLAARIRGIAQACSLTEEQRTQLELAGQGDISRFFNRFNNMLRTCKLGSISQQEWQENWQLIQPYRNEFTRGLHSEDSLFAKSLEFTLGDQLDNWEKASAERQLRAYQADIKIVLAQLDCGLPLTDEQRKKLTDVLLAQDISRGYSVTAQYRAYLVLYRMSQIPDEELRPIFLDNEWKIVEAIRNQMKGLEPFLRQQGVILD